jgi:hypothetical protein
MAIEINKTKVSTRRTPDGDIFLFHAPSARVVTLDPAGQKLWTKIEGGKDDIAQLVAEHRTETGATPEAAAFQVLSFLDILRAEDFVRFSLDASGAPLLDVTLNTPSPLEFQSGPAVLDAAPDIAEAIGRSEVTTRRATRPTLTLAELKKMAEERTGTQIASIRQVKTLDLDPTEISDSTFLRIAAGKLTDDTAHERRFVQLDTVPPETTLRHLESLQRRGQGDTQGGEVKRSVTRIVVIIIIIDHGPIIVIVIDGGDGPTFGKSRNACKTVCV